jgi:hypothetical protein
VVVVCRREESKGWRRDETMSRSIEFSGVVRVLRVSSRRVDQDERRWRWIGGVGSACECRVRSNYTLGAGWRGCFSRRQSSEQGSSVLSV